MRSISGGVLGWFWCLLTLVVLAAACSSGSGTSSAREEQPTAEVLGESEIREPTPANPTPGRPTQVPDIPAVDISQASVDLDDVVFDTLDSGLTLTNATDDDRFNLLDLVPPLDDPLFDGAVDDPWLEPADRVLGFVADDGTPYAFPYKMLALHEIVNVTLAEQQVVVTYSSLADTAAVFSRSLERPNQVLTFSNTSALLYNGVVMVDRETGSYWWQVTGRSVVGTLNEAQLTLLPSSAQTWSAWVELHADTRVLSRVTGVERDYTEDRLDGYPETLDEGFTPFPVPADVLDDERLSPATQVEVVRGAEPDGAVFALAFDPASEATAIALVDLEGTPVVMLVDSGSVGVYVAELNGEPLELQVTDAGFSTLDGTVVDVQGVVIAGPGQGSTLVPYPSQRGFWFSILSAFPQVEVVGA